MNYTQKQQDLIRRIEEVSKLMNELVAEERVAHEAAAKSTADAVTQLTNAMRYAAIVGELSQRHGELFREFLDTL